MNHITANQNQSQEPSPLEMTRFALWETYRFVLRHWIDLTEDYPPDWDADHAFSMFSTTAIFDDPPEGWGKSRLAQFARGRAYGEASLADNLRYQIEHYMLRMGMESDIAPSPWDIEKGKGAETLRKWLIEHRNITTTNEDANGGQS